jgi:hypothetical protein
VQSAPKIIGSALVRKNPVTILLAVFSASTTQERSDSDTTANISNTVRSDTYVALAGEAAISNYGFTISFPIFWIENREKAVPFAGFFWE